MIDLTNYNDYVKAARKTSGSKSLTLTESRLLNWTLGIAGEFDEIRAEISKVFLQPNKTTNRVSAFRDLILLELGDLCWYVAMFAQDFALDFHADVINKAKHGYVQKIYGQTDVQLKAKFMDLEELDKSVHSLCELVKHHIFHSRIKVGDKELIIEILIELMQFIIYYGNKLNANLDTIMEMNIKKLENRHGGKFNASK